MVGSRGENGPNNVIGGHDRDEGHQMGVVSSVLLRKFYTESNTRRRRIFRGHQNVYGTSSQVSEGSPEVPDTLGETMVIGG